MKDAWETLNSAEEGDKISVRIEDFDNTRCPREENPRCIEGKVKKVKESVGYSAGEISRTVVLGDPWDDGCNIDVGDTADNNLTGGGGSSHKYINAWRPRRGKDRLLLGEVVLVEVKDK